MYVCIYILCVYIYICIYIYYVYIYVYIYWLCMYVYIYYVYIYWLCMYVYIYILCVYIYILIMYVCMYIYIMYIYIVIMYVYIYIYIIHWYNNPQKTKTWESENLETTSIPSPRRQRLGSAASRAGSPRRSATPPRWRSAANNILRVVTRGTWVPWKCSPWVFSKKRLAGAKRREWGNPLATYQ